MLALDLFSQVSIRDLQILPHLTVIVEEGQVAILDTDQLQQEVKSTEPEVDPPPPPLLRSGLNPSVSSSPQVFRVVNNVFFFCRIRGGNDEAGQPSHLVVHSFDVGDVHVVG